MKWKYQSFTVCVAGLYLFFIYCIVVTSIPYNPMTVSKKTSFRLKLLIPEGWNFFTKNPRDEQVFIYDFNEQDSTYSSIKSWPNNSYVNFFGIGRTARAIGTDYGMILASIPDSLWLVVEEKDLKLIQRPRSITFQFTSHYPDENSKHVLFGKKLFIKKSLTPWSWFRLNVKTNVKIKYIYGFVQRK